METKLSEVIWLFHFIHTPFISILLQSSTLEILISNMVASYS